MSKDKKITIITGSPREDGNSFALVDAFTEAATKKGHSVTRLDAAFAKVEGCKACETCYQTGKPCSYDDDFNKMASAILEADVLVFAMPLYWYSMPAQIKAVIDKMFSFVIGGKDISGKEYVLIVCWEEDDLSAADGICLPFERIAAICKWEKVGTVLVPNVYRVGDIEKTDGCERAAALAELI